MTSSENKLSDELNKFSDEINKKMTSYEGKLSNYESKLEFILITNHPSSPYIPQPLSRSPWSSAAKEYPDNYRLERYYRR